MKSPHYLVSGSGLVMCRKESLGCLEAPGDKCTCLCMGPLKSRPPKPVTVPDPMTAESHSMENDLSLLTVWPQSSLPSPRFQPFGSHPTGATFVVMSELGRKAYPHAHTRHY